MKVLLNELKLVYPPFSNQLGDWLWKDKEVREYVKHSKLYMIGHREEIIFVDYNWNKDHIFFKIKMGDRISPLIKMYLNNHIKYMIQNDIVLNIEMGKKIIRIIEEESKKVLQWFTPDIFLYLYWENKINVEINDEFNHRDFTKFELFYVGISLKNNSFSRLFEKAHHARLKILTNEGSKNKESRLTDELMLFLFDIEMTNINIIGISDDLNDHLNYHTNDQNAVIADAEKAFVRLLDTKYNEVKFINYPEGLDGLYNKDLDRHSFNISEDISFFTKKAEFNGAFNQSFPQDLILTEKDDSIIVKGSEL